MARPTGGYRNKEGKAVPGVTTIAGRFKDSGGLLYWACEQGKAIQRGEISNLYDKRDQAADSGTLAHNFVEAHIKKQDLPDFSQYPEEIVNQAWKGYENYLNWESMTKVEIIEVEIPLVSEEYQFGGTPDCIIKFNGELALGDFKTSNSVYVDYLLQLAAYNQLWHENYPDRPLKGGFHLLRFGKETADFAHHYYAELDDAWEQFKLFRQAYDIDKKLKK